MSSIITAVENMLFRVPLKEQLGDAMHGKHTHFELNMVKITTEDGYEGYGYTYTGGVGGMAIWQLIESDIREDLVGQDADLTEKIWAALYKKLHYVGRGGIDSFAISAVDIALWDIKCKKAGMPLWKLIGGGNGRARAYGGGIDLDFPKEKLLQNVQGYLDRGHTAIKIKLGKDTLSEDIDRVKAVRELIGPDTLFMVDANYKWTPEYAVRACEKLKEYDVMWLEEPCNPDNLAGYRQVAQQGRMAIAAGENFHTVYEFAHMFEFGHCDFPQPDASNIGGITGWLKVAALAFAREVPVSTHGMQELHVSLLSGVSNSGYLEIHSFPIEDYTTRPLEIKDGYAYPPDEPGTGVVFRFDLLDPYRIK